MGGYDAEFCLIIYQFCVMQRLRIGLLRSVGLRENGSALRAGHW